MLNPVFVSANYFLKEQFSGGQRPNLSEFINGRSFLKWEVNKMDHSHLDWMSQDVEFWDQDENFLKLSEGVKKTRLWMIPVKKSVKSETRFHQTLLLVHELNLLCLGIKRGPFDKKAWAISYQRLSFYRTQVSWSDLCVWFSKTKRRFVKLYWCDSGWWRYKLDTNW